jgi:hypothetical protein
MQRARIIKKGDVNRDDLADVLKLVSSRLTANATKDDKSPTQLRLFLQPEWTCQSAL